MFAIVDIQGKQFKVAKGDVVEAQYLPGEVGAVVTFDKVFLTSDEAKTTVGAPLVKGAAVSAKILAQEKGDKVIIRRFKHKVRYRKSRGFRPLLTKFEIVSIQ